MSFRGFAALLSLAFCAGVWYGVYAFGFAPLAAALK